MTYIIIVNDDAAMIVKGMFMFTRKGISAVRVDLTNIIEQVDKNGDVLVILDRGKSVGALIPMRLAEAIQNAAAMDGPDTDPVEYALSVLQLDSTQSQGSFVGMAKPRN